MKLDAQTDGRDDTSLAITMLHGTQDTCPSWTHTCRNMTPPALEKLTPPEGRGVIPRTVWLLYSKAVHTAHVFHKAWRRNAHPLKYRKQLMKTNVP